MTDEFSEDIACKWSVVAPLHNDIWYEEVSLTRFDAHLKLLKSTMRTR